VIARWAGLDVYEAGEIVLRTDQRLELSSLPGEPRALQDVAAHALGVPADLTAFQGLLPVEILIRELGDTWVKAAVHERSLERLRRARLSAAPFEALAPLSA
jgi:hypothetical protein